MSLPLEIIAGLRNLFIVGVSIYGQAAEDHATHARVPLGIGYKDSARSAAYHG